MATPAQLKRRERIQQRLAASKNIAESTPAPQFDPEPEPTTKYVAPGKIGPESQFPKNNLQSSQKVSDPAYPTLKAETQSELEQRVGFNAAPQTFEERAQILKTKQQSEIDKFLEQAKSKTTQLNEQLEGSKAAIAQQFAQDREAVISTADEGITKTFGIQAERRQKELFSQLESANIQIRDIQAQQQESLVRGERGRQLDLEAQLQSAISERKRLELEGDKFAAEQSQKSAALLTDARDQISGFINDVGGIENFSQMDTGSVLAFVNSLATGTGLDQDQARLLATSTLARHALSQQIAQTKDGQKAAGLLELFNSMDVAPTEAVKNVAALDFMRKSGVDEATIEAFKRQSGLSESGKFEMKGNAEDGYFMFDPLKGEIKVPNGMAIPQGTKYSYDVNQSGGLDIGVQPGQKAGQCGRFANDVLGGKIFGDSYDQKRSMVNSNSPVVGSAFIMKTDGSYGHVGMIENINADGSLAVVDSNYLNRSAPETVNRRVIKKGSPEYNSIVGYYVPPSAFTKKNATLERIKNGLVTPSEYSALESKAEKEGWLQEFTQAISDPKNKIITENTALKFKADTSMNKRQLDQLVEKRAAAGFGSVNFQTLPNTKEGLGSFQGMMQLGRRLGDVKELWDKFKSGEDLNLGEDQIQQRRLAQEKGLIGEGGYSLKGIGSKIGRTADVISTYLGGETEGNLRLYQQIEGLTGENLAEFIKEISGAAVSEQEAQRLSKLKPNVSMNDQQFTDQLNRMTEDYEAMVQSKLNVWGFNSKEQMFKAVENYGQMPTDLNSFAEEDINPDDSFLKDLGYSSDTDDIYNNNFSSIR